MASLGRRRDQLVSSPTRAAPFRTIAPPRQKLLGVGIVYLMGKASGGCIETNRIDRRPVAPTGSPKPNPAAPAASLDGASVRRSLIGPQQ